MFCSRHFPAVVLTLLLAALACRPAPQSGFEIPLLDTSHTPDVLTESRGLAFPPSLEGNRFLRGWRLQRGEGQRRLAAQPRPAGSSLEFVNLEARPRQLILSGEFAELPENATVAVRAAGTDLGKVPLVDPLEISLPADLPLGRVPITLQFPELGHIQMRQATLKGVLPAGEVQVENGEIRQAGHSLVDLVRRLETTAVLRMRFTPPSHPQEGQRFSLLLESEGEEPTTVFTWQPSLWNRLRGARNFEVPLPQASGLVRFRLLAQGPGPAANWRPRLWFPQVAEPPGAEPSPPSPPRLVLLYVLDALRADTMGHLGGPEGISPHFDALAAAGVSFTQHMSVAPNTLPSSMSLFTGQIFLDLPQGRWKLAADGPETLAEVFHNAGFETAIFAANGYLSKSFGTTRGFDFDGRQSIYDPGFVTGPYNDSAERVHRSTLAWLDQRSSERPAFLYLHSLNPHNPYDPPEPFRSRFAPGTSTIDGETKTLSRIQRFHRQVDAADEEQLRGLYAAGLAYNDSHFGAFLAALEQRFAPGEVLLIVTSDHGDEFFEHGGILHGYTLYQEQLAIPLIFHWPGHLQPTRLATATDNLDLHETLRSLVGAPHSGRGAGRSLWPVLSAPASGDDGKGVRFAVASSVKGGIYMARSATAKLIWAPRSGGGWGLGEGRGRSRDAEYFFDLVQDPGETSNRIDTPSLETTWLRSRLRAWIETSRGIEAGSTEDGGELDEETRQQLKALGYLD